MNDNFRIIGPDGRCFFSRIVWLHRLTAVYNPHSLLDIIGYEDYNGTNVYRIYFL